MAGLAGAGAFSFASSPPTHAVGRLFPPLRAPSGGAGGSGGGGGGGGGAPGGAAEASKPQHAPGKRRVMILMSDTGGGHRASAEALKAAFEIQFGALRLGALSSRSAR